MDHVIESECGDGKVIHLFPVSHSQDADVDLSDGEDDASHIDTPISAATLPAMLPPAQIEAHYGITIEALKAARLEGTGAEFVRYGNEFFYARESLDAWIHSNTLTHSSYDAKWLARLRDRKRAAPK